MDNDSAVEWFESYMDKPQQGREALLKLAYVGQSNHDLAELLQSAQRGPMVGLAASILAQRQQIGSYTGRVTFDAPWAGAYTSWKGDYAGACTTYCGDNVLYGAKFEGNYVLALSNLRGNDVLNHAQFVGNHIMRNAKFSGSGISHVDVIGNHFMYNADVEGTAQLLSDVTVQGDSAFMGANISKMLNRSGHTYKIHVKGDNAFRYCHFRGDLYDVRVDGDVAFYGADIDTVMNSTVHGADAYQLSKINGTITLIGEGNDE